MVVHEPHPENRRTDCWFMTRAGYREMQRGGDIVEGIVARMLASLSKADAARLSDLLQECAGALQGGTEESTRRAGAGLNGSSRTARS
jgi:hypothetical protein